MSLAQNVWKTPPENLILENSEAHVWKVLLNRSDSQIDRLKTVLLPDEHTRAGRFYFQKDRDAFTIARGMLRIILSRYVRFEPNELAFDYSSYGKPSLQARFNANMLQFNLSHSHHIALIAVCWQHEIGVDVEWMRDTLSDMQIAERFFSPAEVAALLTVPPAEQKGAFFNCWTRKEAFIKAKGMGLSIPLDQFDVSLKPGEPAVLQQTGFEPDEACKWAMIDVPLESDYRAALAISRTITRITYWQAA
ncbi:MAG: 4'-phosphopantetheinyl transferase family protein [Candidatus Zhuqueibacterota bacterium]